MAKARLEKRPLPVPTTAEVVIVEMTPQQANAVRYVLSCTSGPGLSFVLEVSRAIALVADGMNPFFVRSGAKTEDRS